MKAGWRDAPLALRDSVVSNMHHYYDYYYHHHCYHQNRYPHLEYHYLKYYLEYNSGNKLVFIRTFRKLFTNLTQKVMSTPKN